VIFEMMFGWSLFLKKNREEKKKVELERFLGIPELYEWPTIFMEVRGGWWLPSTLSRYWGEPKY